MSHSSNIGEFRMMLIWIQKQCKNYYETLVEVAVQNIKKLTEGSIFMSQPNNVRCTPTYTKLRHFPPML